MTDIPEDIMATARALADSVSFGGYEVNTLSIAKAIRAERQRCASICDFYAEKYGQRSEVREDAAHEIRGFIQGVLIRGEA